MVTKFYIVALCFLLLGVVTRRLPLRLAVVKPLYVEMDKRQLMILGIYCTT
jgi:hypothetical protein